MSDEPDGPDHEREAQKRNPDERPPQERRDAPENTREEVAEEGVLGGVPGARAEQAHRLSISTAGSAPPCRPMPPVTHPLHHRRHRMEGRDPDDRTGPRPRWSCCST